jgi:endonuclease/exonuclease/phosphatase family metal-dependent hydrolase
LLRSLGSTMDLSNEGMFRAITLLLTIIAAVLIPPVFRHEVDGAGPMSSDKDPGWGKTILLGIGIVSVFTLLYFAFTSPTVISRWTEVNYLLILLVATVALVLFVWLLASRRNVIAGFSRVAALTGTAVFALALTLTLWVNQAILPDEPGLYPVADPGVSPFWIISLLVMLILYPILFLDFGLLVEEIVHNRPTFRKLGLGFGLASLLMLFLVLSNVFTSVWAYIDPILEPFFRYKFWFYHFIPAVLLALSLLAVRKETADMMVETAHQSIGRGFAALVTAVGIIALVGAFLLSPVLESPAGPADRLKVAGYNIHQGYDVGGQRSHQAQCALLDQINADIVSLSESDTARIAGGNFDAPRFLADCLDVDSYVGPKTGAGTFGYALLSKFPIENAEVFHLFSGPGFPSAGDPEKRSGGDQVAVIKSQVRLGDETFNIFVNHFDSNPPREQPEGFVKLVKGLDHVIAIGDYNCQPDTECFAIITETLNNCAGIYDDPDVAQGRIDHIFVSPDLQCQNFTYVESSASDHPVVVAEIVW